MVITISSDVIRSSKRGELECPLFNALSNAGLKVSCVDIEHFLHSVNGEMFLQELPSSVSNIIKKYDKSGIMDEFNFELPNL